MTYREYLSWVKYWRKHGSLDAGRRIDRTLGIVASHFAQAFIKYKNNFEPTPDNFTLYPEFAEAKDESGSIDDVFKFLSALGKKDG